MARTSDLTEDAVRRLIAEHTQDRKSGILGEPRVNVLTLNLALDGLGSLARLSFGAPPSLPAARRTA